MPYERTHTNNIKYLGHHLENTQFQPSSSIVVLTRALSTRCEEYNSNENCLFCHFYALRRLNVLDSRV